MKAFKLSMILLLAFAIQTNAQNYQCFNSGDTYFYAGLENNIKPVRIDSVHIETDSILYPFYIIMHQEMDCYSPNIASWIGDKVIIKENGDNLFFNKNNDTICIKTHAVQGESWIALQITDSTFVQANVTSHELMTFLDTQDSVKTIKFQAYNSDMQSIESAVNGLEICLSKNYGLIKTLDFYYMPDYEVHLSYIYDQTSEHEIVGHSSIETGVENLTWFEVMDFQPGDEIHVGKGHSSSGPDGESWSETKSIYKYLERTNYQDSIVYTYSLEKSYKSVDNMDHYTSYTFDTITETIFHDMNFDKLPWEANYSNDSIIMFTHYMSTEIFQGKYKPTHIQLYNNEDCWELILFDGCDKDLLYLKGLSGPYYQCSNTLSSGGSSRSLIYYKKGDEIWGEPYTNLSSESNVIDHTTVKVFPNPAKSEINVSFDNSPGTTHKLKIFDMNGRIMKTITLNDMHSKVDVRDLPKGLYMYSIDNEKENVHKGKLVIGY